MRTGMRTGMELEHEQLVKGVNKCELGKKKLLVEILAHFALSYNT